MRIPALVCAAMLIGSLSFAQTAQPLRNPRRLVPPNPRDGEGTGTTILPILIYHSIRPYTAGDTLGTKRYIATPQAFEAELAYLRANGCTSVSFDDLADHITKGTPLPANPVIISFDDDWEGQYTYGFPLLKKYGFTGTFYIWVNVVGRRHHMTWDEIRDLAANGMQIGCHTMTHLYLTRIAGDAQLRREIVRAKQIIEARVGVRVTTFAYPFGQYDERVVAAAKEAGFTTARSTWPGVVHSQEGLFSLTGLLRTETESSLAASMERYLAEAEQRVEGTAAPGAVAPAAPAAATPAQPLSWPAEDRARPAEARPPARAD